MVERLDLLEPEGVGEVRAALERTLVKYRGRRVLHAGFFERDAFSRFHRRRYHRRSSSGESLGMGSSASSVPPTRPEIRDYMHLSTAPHPVEPSKSRTWPSRSREPPFSC